MLGPDFLHWVRFFACCLYLLIYTRVRLSNELSNLRHQLLRAYAAMAHTLRRLQRSEPVVQGSFYLLRRNFGRPNSRCARVTLHATYVLTPIGQSKARLYTVLKDQRARLRQK